MNYLVLLGLLVAVLGCVGIYLSSPRQRWLRTPLPARSARGSGFALLVGAWSLWALELHPLTATYVLLTTVMAHFVVLPYLGAYVALRREGAR